MTFPATGPWSHEDGELVSIGHDPDRLTDPYGHLPSPQTCAGCRQPITRADGSWSHTGPTSCLTARPLVPEDER